VEEESCEGGEAETGPLREERGLRCLELHCADLRKGLFDLAEQVVDLEWLRHVVASAGLNTFNGIERTVPCGEEDDGYILELRHQAYFPCQLKAVESRHHHVEDEQLWTDLCCQDESSTAVTRRNDVELGQQHAFKQSADRGV